MMLAALIVAYLGYGAWRHWASYTAFLKEYNGWSRDTQHDYDASFDWFQFAMTTLFWPLRIMFDV